MIGYKVVLNNYKNISLLGDVSYDTNELKTSSYADGERGFFFYPSFHAIPLSILEFSSGGTVTPVKIIEVETDDESAAYNSHDPEFAKNMIVETWRIKRVDSLKEYSPAEYIANLINEYSNANANEIRSYMFNEPQNVLLHIAFMSYNGIKEEEILRILKIEESTVLTYQYYNGSIEMITRNHYSNIPLSIAYQYGIVRMNGSKPDEILRKYILARSRRDSANGDEKHWINLAGLELKRFNEILASRYFKDR